MLKGLVDGDPLVRVDHEHFREKVSSLRCFEPTVFARVAGEQNVREKLLERVPCIARSIFDVISHSWLQSSHKISTRSAQLLDDLVPLVDVVAARKEHSAPDHFSHYTTDRPYIYVLFVSHTFNENRLINHRIEHHERSGFRMRCFFFIILNTDSDVCLQER